MTDELELKSDRIESDNIKLLREILADKAESGDTDKAESSDTDKPEKNSKKAEWIVVIPLEYFAIRSAPTVSAPVLLYATRGKPLSVEKSGKPWLKVKHPKLADRIGYISATVLDGQPKKG